jgi:endoglycosylceramidase
MPVLDSNHNREPLQAFAPHGYDIVTDTEEVANARNERIELIYERHAETAKRLGMPALVGEWGAFYGQPDTLPAAQMVARQIEKYLFSDTYWAYGSSKEMDNAPYFPIIVRPYPAAVAGTLLRYESDLADGKFSCVWKEEPTITAPNRIYLPAQWFPEGYSISLEPEAKDWSFEPAIAGSSSGYLVIPSTGGEIERSLTVQSPKKIGTD